jgi:hypothetical protein
LQEGWAHFSCFSSVMNDLANSPARFMPIIV